MAEIKSWMIQSYQTAITHLSQEAGDKVWRIGKPGTQSSETDWTKELAPTSSIYGADAVNADTEYLDVTKTRRAINLRGNEWPHIVDDFTNIEEGANDPTNEYVQNASLAIARRRDWVAIRLLSAPVIQKTNDGGQETVNFDTTNRRVAVNYGGGGNDVNLNLEKLLKAREIMESANGLMSGELAYYIGSPKQKMALLNNTKVTSADYNTVKALVNGELDTFAGCKFIWSNQLEMLSGSATDEIGLMVGANAFQFNFGAGSKYNNQFRIDPLPNKKYNWQIFFKEWVGGTRIDDAKVVQVLNDITV